MGVYGARDGKLIAKKLIVEDKIPIHYVIPATATVATGGIVSGLDVNAASTAVTVEDYLVQPPYPLNIGVTPNTAAGVLTNRLRITGVDAQGNTRYEDVYIASTAGSTQYTNYSYAKITSLQPYNSSGVITASDTDDIGVGYGNQVGLPGPIASSADLMAYVVGSTHATTAPTIDITYNQVTVSGADTVNKTVNIIYLSQLQE